MLAGIFGYVFFNVGYPNHMFQAASMVMTLGAALLLMLGPGIFRFLALPVVFLLFMSTISEAVMNVVTFPLQLLASKGAWLILALLGKPLGYGVEVAGNNLTLYPASGAPVPLNVAEQCSGMRMVIAFIALASAYALLGCRGGWERLALVLIASPVAILMNVVRVAVLGLLSLIDPKLAEGQAHMLIGTLLLVPALGLYFLCHKALERVFVDPRATAKVQAQASERRVLRRSTPTGGAP
jgi:exosortase